MTEALEEVGIDPDATPTDHLPERGAWAIASDWKQQNGESWDE